MLKNAVKTIKIRMRKYDWNKKELKQQAHIKV